jgi:hypothetical protein
MFSLSGRTQPPYEMHRAPARKQKPSGRFKVEAKPNIRVHVLAIVVEIQRGHAGVGIVVPIAKADRNALTDLH